MYHHVTHASLPIDQVSLSAIGIPFVTASAGVCHVDDFVGNMTHVDTAMAIIAEVDFAALHALNLTLPRLSLSRSILSPFHI